MGLEASIEYTGKKHSKILIQMSGKSFIVL